MLPSSIAHALPQVVRLDAALERADQGHQEEVPHSLFRSRQRTLQRNRIAGRRAGGREVLEDELVEAVARRREDPRRDPQHPLAGRGEVKGHLPGEQVELDLERDAMRHRRVALEVDQQPVLEAEQHHKWQDDDSQRDPEDATASESRAPESPEK